MVDNKNGVGVVDAAIDAVKDDDKPSKSGVANKLSPDQLPYWAVVNQGVQRAQSLMNQAGAIEAQAKQMRDEAQALIGAYNSYASHLGQVHGLDVETDRIEPDGRIVLGEKASA